MYMFFTLAIVGKYNTENIEFGGDFHTYVRLQL